MNISGLWQIFEVFQVEMTKVTYAVYGCYLCLPKSFCFTKDVCTVPLETLKTWGFTKYVFYRVFKLNMTYFEVPDGQLKVAAHSGGLDI